MSVSFTATDALELRASRAFEEIFAGLQGRSTIRTIDFVANEPIETGEAMLILAAKCVGKPERRNDIMRVASTIVAPSRAEAGCISYSIHERLLGEDKFLFFEEWADQAALDFHFNTTHFQEFIREFTPLLQAPPDIRIYEVSEARTLEL